VELKLTLEDYVAFDAARINQTNSGIETYAPPKNTNIPGRINQTNSGIETTFAPEPSRFRVTYKSDQQWN